MKKRELGSTGLFVNEIGYGSMNLSINRATRLPENEAIQFLQKAVDEYGVEFIDTADAYCADEHEMGHGERLIAKALEGDRRRRVLVATKGGFTRPEGKWIPNGRPDYLRHACENSLRNLATDAIDLYQFHRPDPQVPLEDSLGALADMQQEGKIRHVGVSNFTLEQLEQGMRVVNIVSVQNPLNPFILCEGTSQLLRFCLDRRISWIAYAPVGGHRSAYMIAAYQDWMKKNLSTYSGSAHSMVLAWLLHVSPMILPIPATTNIQHLAANMNAGEIQLTDDDVAKLPDARSWYSDFFEANDTKDYAAAVEILKKIIALNDQDSVPWYNLARTHAAIGDRDQAFDALGRFSSLLDADADEVRKDEVFAGLLDDPRFDKLFGTARQE